MKRWKLHKKLAREREYIGQRAVCINISIKVSSEENGLLCSLRSIHHKDKPELAGEIDR